MNDYYVYLHKRIDNGSVFYVGSGRGRRSHSVSSRGSKWKKIAKLGFLVEILASNLSKLNSIRIEQEYYDNHFSTLVNVNRPSTVSPIEYAEVIKHVHVDASSPSGLMWNHPNDRQGKRKREYAGSLYARDGYWRVTIAKKRFMAHRVVWLLSNGVIDDLEVIDHIDGDRSNNKIENLRLVSHGINCRNVKVSKNNSLNVLGVRSNTRGYNVNWVDSNSIPKTKQISYRVFGFHAFYYSIIYSSVMRFSFGGRYDEYTTGIPLSTAYDIVRFIDQTIDSNSTNTGCPFITKDSRGMLIAQKKIKDIKHSCSFSIKKYGYDVALKLCKDFLA